MKKCCSIVSLMFAAAVVARAQTTSPAPVRTPPPENDVVRISTNLIQVDVTVTDRKGDIVRDLRADEIEIFENGKRQKISNFSFISNVRAASEVERKSGQAALPLPTGPPRPERVRRTIALVVDDLGLSFESTYYVRRALKKFVDEQMQDGDLVGIIRTAGGIGALQQFTTDRRQLHAAIEKVRWNMAGTGRVGAFEPLRALHNLGTDGLAPAGGRTPEEMERDLNEFRNSVFATGTMGAVNFVIRGMQELPGRKSIMLLSDGFKLFTQDRDGLRESSRVMESLRRLIDQAHRASVVIYTLDPRGLQTAGLTAADNTGDRTPAQIESEMALRTGELRETQDGLVYLARQTGGYAIINNNDISGSIRRILDDQSFYLIGYTPDDETFDPRTRRFNRLEVKVSRPGTLVRYRSGFFAVSDETRLPTAATGNQRLLSALISPFAVNDISLRINALFGRNTAKASIIRSLLHVSAKDLTFTDGPNNTKLLKFDILAIGFGDNGVPVDQIAYTHTVTLNNDQYQTFLRRGFVYDFAFPIKKAGAYQLRVAIRDHATGRVGSANQFIEVPDLKNNRLTLSGAGLENTTFEEWEKRNNSSTGIGSGGTDPLTDTSLRQFKNGTVLNYGFVIFNAKTDSAKQPNLSFRTRLFRDGKPIFEGKLQPVVFAGQTDPKAVNFMSSLSLGTALGVGEYVLEVAITDNLAKGKNATAANYIQFEIVD
ncbi:MAG: VWA domain-containing protein [Pyrinomonadaceae bacterium]